MWGTLTHTVHFYSEHVNYQFLFSPLRHGNSPFEVCGAHDNNDDTKLIMMITQPNSRGFESHPQCGIVDSKLDSEYPP